MASTPRAPAWRRHLTRGLVAVVGLALVVALAGWLQGLGGSSKAPQRQVAKISLLPDRPPPPPPPPKEEPPPPPKVEPKTVVREEQIKQAEAPKPANEPLKMEGAAGDGPSAFAAGTVRNEYAGGTPQIGPAASAAAPRDRALERFYVNTAKQMLRDALEANFRSDIDQASAEFTLYVQRDGGIHRVEVAPSGDARLDAELRAALDQTSRSLRLPPPPERLGGGEPLRFRMTVKPQA
jgi:type IV secretory pathway VirB10-like protein